MPGNEGLSVHETHFQAGQRRTLGVGVPGNEGLSVHEPHFQAGQRAHLHDVCGGGLVCLDVSGCRGRRSISRHGKVPVGEERGGLNGCAWK